MEKISFLNDEFLPHEKCFVHIEDRGFQLGDGVYEVILYYQNTLIDFDLHCDRLQRSLDLIQLKFDKTREEIKKIILKLVVKNNLESGYIYLQITRGTHARMQAFPTRYTPTFVATVSPFINTKKEDLENGLSAVTHADIRWNRCDIKSVSLLGGCLMKQYAAEKNAAEAILIKDGYITEASFSNVFIVDKNGNLITRNADNFILRGITRDRIIALAKENNIKVIERKFTSEELFSASEVFVSSSTLMIRPISKIDDKIIASGKTGDITKKLIKLYNEFIG